MGLRGVPEISHITNEEGISWQTFREQLTPRYLLVWRDLLLILGMIILGSFGLTQLSLFQYEWLLAIAGIAIAFWLGFWFHAWFLLFHEAAHFNLLHSRTWNDRVANLLFGLFLAIDVRSYRRSHWRHHTELGTTADPENSYFQPLSPRSMVLDLLGFYLLYNFFRYLAMFFGQENTAVAQPAADAKPWVFLLAAAILHLGICLALYRSGNWYSPLLWVFAIIGPMGWFSRIRQTLEHRSPTANPATDYSQEAHGAFVRSFSNDFFSRWFGAAGFNQHLLHHWDPAISYTNFAEMDRFFRGSRIRELLEANRGSYFQALGEQLEQERK